jgi:PAS domain-containing protein
MVQASPDPILLLDGVRIVAASPACEALLGRSPESLIGRGLAELGPVGDGDLRRLCERLTKGLEKAVRVTISLWVSGMSAITVELHCAPVASERGRRTVAVARRVEHRDDREREAERLGTMLAVAEVSADEVSRLRGCLELIREECGATSVELIRPDAGAGAVRESYRDPPAAPPVGERRLADWDRLLATTSGPVVVPDDDRSPGCWLIAGVTLLGGGGGQWLVGAHLDRSATSELPDRLRRAVQVLGWVVGRVERDRQVEALLRERELLLGVLDSAGVPAVVTDADSHVEFASEAFCALLGTDPEEVAGLALPELVDGTTASRLLGPLQVLLSEGGSWEGELHGTSRWGAPLMLRLRLEAHVGPDGRPIGLVACAVTGQPRPGPPVAATTSPDGKA